MASSIARCPGSPRRARSRRISRPCRRSCRTPREPTMRSLLILAVASALSGCSLKQYTLNNVSDALANSGSVFAADDDPELVRAAAPFSLKLTESLVAENPRHQRLLVAADRGFTLYAYAFRQQEAEEIEEQDLARSTALHE